MSTVTRNFIEYSGISEEIPEGYSSFKQIVTNVKFCLPIEKPDIEQITKAAVSTKIIHTAVISTPKGTSYEGFQLTGSSLIVVGELIIKLQYVGDLEEQSVHTSYFASPFAANIVLNKQLNSQYVDVEIFVEDLDITNVGSRCFNAKTAIYIVAENC